MSEEVSIERKDRISNLEMLRIITMILIVLDHVPCSDNALSINKAISDFYFLGGKFGVNTFVILGGGLLVGKAFNFRRILRLVCEVVFYSIIGLVYYLCVYHRLSIHQLILSIKYWFPFAYIIMLLGMPVINKLSIEVCKAISIIGLVMSSALTIYLILNPGGLMSKLVDNAFIMGPVWFCFLYTLLRTLIENEVLSRFNNWKLWLVVYIATYLLMYVFVRHSWFWIRGMISPVCLFSSLAFVNIFRYITPYVSRAVNSIAGSTFGVYLFHTNKLICDDIWNKLLDMKNASEVGVLWLLRSCIAVISIFVVALILTFVRKTISRVTKHIDEGICNLFDNALRNLMIERR